MTLRTAARQPSRGHEAPARRTRQSVNLFDCGTLVAQRWTERGRPHPYYVVHDVIYDVTSFARTTDSNSRPVFDAQVTARHVLQAAAPWPFG